MKKILGTVVIAMLNLGIICNLFSCRMKESYKTFNIRNITDNLNEDYFSSENFSFATLENVVIIPEIKAINHSEYKIYISAYSKSGNEKVQIKNVVLRDEENILLKHQLCEEITFAENDESIYEGWIEGGIFTDDMTEIEDGKKLDIIVEVEIINNDDTAIKNMTYEIVIKGYKSFVLPT